MNPSMVKARGVTTAARPRAVRTRGATRAMRAAPGANEPAVGRLDGSVR